VGGGGGRWGRGLRGREGRDMAEVWNWISSIREKICKQTKISFQGIHLRFSFLPSLFQDILISFLPKLPASLMVFLYISFCKTTLLTFMKKTKTIIYNTVAKINAL
jgi:hypothetical protein